MKTCRKCGVEKPTDLFYNRSSSSDGLANQCKECMAEYQRERYTKRVEYHREYNRKYYQTHDRRDIKKAHYERVGHLQHVQRKYKLTPKAYLDLLNSQNGVCAICKEPSDKRLHVDHDHRCCSGGKNASTCGQCTRALICFGCNAGLGSFKDNADTIRSAAKYLDRWSNV